MANRKSSAPSKKTTKKPTSASRSRATAARSRAQSTARKKKLVAFTTLHKRLMAGGLILIVLVFAYLGIKNVLDSYAAIESSAVSFIGIGGKCLDNQHSVLANHNPIQLYTCNGTNAQKWLLQSDGSIRNVSGNYCIDVKGASTAEYTYVQLYTCNGTVAQKWDTKNSQLVNTNTGFCLTDRYGSTANSTPQWMRKCIGTAQQKWVAKSTVVLQPPTSTPTPPPSDSGSGSTSGSGSSTGGTLIFDDEFSGAANAAPDSSKWELMGGTSPSRWGVECYVNDRAHIKLDGQGHLIETATYSPGGVPCRNGSGPYESGGMTTGSATGGLFTYKYGTIEARIQVPCQSGTGLWPAWWADGPSWPKGGEIDYLEIMNVAQKGNTVVQTLHGPTTSGGAWQTPFSTNSSTPWCQAFHTYGAIWSQGKIDFTIDGNITHSFTPSSMPSGGIWPFDTYAERLLLNLEIGSWGGTPNPATFPQSMVVDYVRAYK